MDLHPLIEEWDVDLHSGDPLSFPGYAARLAELDGESVRTGRTEHYVLIEGRFEILGGSMGVVHGEKVVRAFNRATELRLPVLVITSSGGARMQEGMVSLIQLPRTAKAARQHRRAGLMSVALHRSPTTGGVFVSYGSLCALSAVEEGATIGFAGPRVVEQLVGERVGFKSHNAVSAYLSGLVDALLAPEEVKPWIEGALGMADLAMPLLLRGVPKEHKPRVRGAWGEVQRARWKGRPTGIDVANALCHSWVEMRGTDPVIRTAVAKIGSHDVVVIASDRYAEDGSPGPDGYRLAQRAIELSDNLGLPLLTLVDMPGAEVGSEAENDGISVELALTHAAMAELKSPSVSVCVGEGGSGGALALASADRLLMQEHAIFSVIGPEGAAAILERDATKASKVAPLLKLTSTDLLGLGIIDAVVPEDVDELLPHILVALDEAKPGDRWARNDAASARWLRTEG